ncbi:MAG TPA: condensation domain-containing protein, partial [Archangium sp.]|nr:condensation domain-containing protein [Archangium sp.]
MSDSSSLSSRGPLLDNTWSSPRVERTAPAPLSFAQRRLWFLEQLAPGQPLYNMPTFVRLSGPLDAPALEQGLQRIVQRHELLRSRLILVEREPMQEVLPDWTLRLEQVDLRVLAPAEREPRLQELMSQEAQRPFDLLKGPLVRASLVQVAEEEHVLLLNMHHIISDGWSMGVLFLELGTFYNAARRGEQAHLPPLPLQYADFSRWQAQWMEGERLEEELSYWKQQLAGAPTRLELPTDRPRPAEQRHRGAFHRFHVPAGTVRALHQLSQEEAVSPFMTLLAAFQVLLSRYSGQEDLCVGTPIANRTRPEVEGLIGFFVNTLVIRTRLTGVSSFRELLGRVGDIALDAYEHQDIPFEKLVEVLQPQRDLSHAPLIQVMFSMQAGSALATSLEGLSLSPIPVDTGTSKFDLTLSLEETAAGLSGDIEYDTALFDEATVARMATHFQVLLEGIVSNPEAPLSSLPLLTPEERQQLLVEWNATSTAYPADS